MNANFAPKPSWNLLESIQPSQWCFWEIGARQNSKWCLGRRQDFQPCPSEDFWDTREIKSHWCIQRPTPSLILWILLIRVSNVGKKEHRVVLRVPKLDVQIFLENFCLSWEFEHCMRSFSLCDLLLTKSTKFEEFLILELPFRVSWSKRRALLP